MRASKTRRILVALAVLGLGLVAVEGFARYWLGLGDPPLSVADQEIEYLFKPGTYRRFGNLIFINCHHMRSNEIAPTKQDPKELRVLVLGDSVINGGALTDQPDLATERVQDQLAISMGRPVSIGNVSAGSWGPGNLLAYVRRFGLFDADVVIVVINSGDIGDNPTGRKVVGIDPNFPDQSPTLAIAEGWTRYVIPRLRMMTKLLAPTKPCAESPNIQRAEADRSLRDLTELFAFIREKNITAVLMFVCAQHNHPWPPA